jgi:hypothetical protein
MHRMEHVLPAKVPHPRLHRAIRASQLQLADVDAVRLSLMRVKGSPLSRLMSEVFPAWPRPTTISFSSRSARPLRPARCNSREFRVRT